MLIPNWAGGVDTALDVTVIYPLQDATVRPSLKGTAATPGPVLDIRYGTKMAGVAEACKREGIVFLPLMVASLGDGTRL